MVRAREEIPDKLNLQGPHKTSGDTQQATGSVSYNVLCPISNIPVLLTPTLVATPFLSFLNIKLMKEPSQFIVFASSPPTLSTQLQTLILSTL